MNLEEYKGVYVFAQQVDNEISSIAFELLGKAKDLAKDLNTEVTAMLLGSGIKGLADQLAEYGADKVIVVDDPELKDYRTEPYVKVLNTAHGYDVYKRYYDKSDYTWKYDIKKPESLLNLDHLGLTQGEIDERTYNYAQNSLVMFPELHKRLRENSIFFGNGETNMKDRMLQLAQYIRQNRLLIYKLC